MTTVPQSVSADLITGFSAALGDFASTLAANALLSGALWGLLGALFALPVLIYMCRRSLLRRRPKAWNVLAKISYVVVFAAIAGGALGIGVVHNAQRSFHAALAEQMHPALMAKMPAIRDYLSARMSKYSPDKRSAKDVLAASIQELYYVPVSDGLWEQMKARSVNWLLRKFGTEFFVEQFQKAVIIKLEAAGAALKKEIHGQAQGQLVQLGADLMVRLGTDASRQVDFAMLDKTVPQALVDVVEKTADGYFNSAYKLIGMIVGALSVSVIAEMLAYFRWYLPRREC
jgi:hypothetical protein